MLQLLKDILRKSKLKTLGFFAGLGGVFLTGRCTLRHSLLRAKRCFFSVCYNDLSGVELALNWRSSGVWMAFEWRWIGVQVAFQCHIFWWNRFIKKVSSYETGLLKIWVWLIRLEFFCLTRRCSWEKSKKFSMTRPVQQNRKIHPLCNYLPIIPFPFT